MITVKIFNSRLEAEMAKGLLETAKINSFVSADDMGGLNPGMATATGVKLQVSPQDFEEAKKILDATPQDS